MKQKLSLKQIKQYELGILKHFDSFCKENALHYTLSEGTLLGAVRHNGFIPWDDDIDVMMPRADFDKLLRLYKNEGRYALIYPKHGSVYDMFMARMTDNETVISFEKPGPGLTYKWGVWIDINPVDTVPDGKKEAEQYERNILLWNKIYHTLARREWLPEVSLYRNVAWFVSRIFLKLLNGETIRQKVYRVMTCYNDSNSRRLGWFSNGHRQVHSFPCEWMSSYTIMEFEGCEFPVATGHDELLRMEYGDYMQMPPEEERMPKHEFTAFLIDNKQT